MTSPEPDDAPAVPPTGQRMSSRQLGRSTAIMASGTLVSRVLGLLRGAMLVAAVGLTGAAADAYDLANKLPNTLYALLAAGVLNSALVPQIVRAFQQPNGKRIVDRILTIGATASVVAGVAFTVAAPIMVRLYSSHWSSDQLALATGLAYWIIPQLTFYGLYTLLGEILNARGQFGPFMWSPVLSNLISIAGFAAYIAMFGRIGDPPPPLAMSAWTPERIAVLGSVATIGIAAQALILIIPLVRGGYRWQWRWRGERGELTTLRTVVTWALAAVGVEQLGVLLTTRVMAAADTFAQGSHAVVAGNAAYFNAMMIYIVPHSLVTVSLLTALFTSMARAQARGDTPGLIMEISRGARLTGVFAIWASATLVTIGPLAVRVLVPTASAASVDATTPVLQTLALGLVPLGLMVLVKRVLFVLEDARSIFLVQIPMTITWIAVAYGARLLVDPQWWTVGVAAGLVASNVVAVVLRTSTLRRRLGRLDGRRIGTVYGRSAIAVLPAIVLGVLLMRLVPSTAQLSGWDGLMVAAGAGLGIVAAMGLVYGIGLKLLHVQELDQVLSPVKRLVRRVR
ncbi:murein biosynthesis integral membrane protein MurJ [Demequina capsici]|uniref:Lipid II flippase MurJ n=1 Tax=Demequina capsici TaxID=3075620 RepID=A0AA96J7Y2_9MICO|nr:lipid II flippase MurJ [Demequina sp. OYTSA14]WNM24478.1 lipid II flippase MurJ [Demequina sp. OYTSA14]